MFTGIVEAVGVVVEAREMEGIRHLAVTAPDVVDGLEPGQSLSVDGACLTVVALRPDGFEVDVVQATLSRTIVGGYGPGTRVNLERALRVGDRLDGHVVQGHVDGVGALRRIESEGDHRLLDFALPEDVQTATVLHGSIAINGVSLTVHELPAPGTCRVAVIPHTWEHTNLSDLAVGDPINVEGDLIGKYVGRMLAARQASRGPAPPEPPPA